MIDHNIIPVGEHHSPHQWVFANQAAREAAVILDPQELDKWALQRSDGSFWRLTGVNPAAWTQLSLATVDFLYGEVPAGVVDGVNTVFTLLYPPSPAASCAVWIRYGGAGAWLRAMYSYDFALAANVITLTLAPDLLSDIVVDYRTLSV